MINNKALVCSYVAKMFADGTKYHKSIKESDNPSWLRKLPHHYQACRKSDGVGGIIPL